ncbi:MAG: apolipoprotein N-acyltransferase [Myxococcota bacterium]|nr:apolipoprotein N-acyltransferase [Myxococcota bacterium]
MKYWAVGLALGSGLLHVLALPPDPFGPLAFVALVPFLAVLRLESHLGMRLLLGFSFGLVTVVGTSYWMPESIAQGNGVSPVVALGLAVGVTLWFTLAFVGFPLLLQWIERGRLAGPFSAPIAWVTLEALRGAGMPAVEWLVYAHTQSGHSSVIQLADWAGAPGLSFVLVLVNSLIVESLLPRAGRRRWSFLVSAAILTVGLLLAGQVKERAEEALRLQHPDESVRVAVGQLAIPQSDRWVAEEAWPRIDRMLALSRQAFGEGAQWIVWPETSVETHIDKAEGLGERIRRQTGEWPQSKLIVGAPRESRTDQESVFFNSAVLLGTSGNIEGLYDKVMLYPITEASPRAWMWIPGFDRIFKEQLKWVPYSPGEWSQPLMNVSNVPVGVIICSEALGSSMARHRVDQGAQVLIHMANDGVIPGDMPAAQHFAIVRLRAIELRRPLLRSSNLGLSAIVSATGEVLADHGGERPGIAVATIRPRRDRTLYARAGWLLPWVCGAIALMGGLLPKNGLSSS